MASDSARVGTYAVVRVLATATVNLVLQLRVQTTVRGSSSMLALRLAACG